MTNADAAAFFAAQPADKPAEVVVVREATEWLFLASLTAPRPGDLSHCEDDCDTFALPPRLWLSDR